MAFNATSSGVNAAADESAISSVAFYSLWLYLPQERSGCRAIRQTINAMYTISNIEVTPVTVRKDLNGHFELCLESNQPLPRLEAKEVYASSGAHFFFGEEDGYVSFYITNDHDREHGPKYHWSSRPSVFRNLGYDCVGYARLKDGRGYVFAIDLTPEKMTEILSELGYGLVSVHDYGDASESELIIVNNEMLEQIKLKEGDWGSKRTEIDSIYLEPRV